jgi:hypothetical protein
LFEQSRMPPPYLQWVTLAVIDPRLMSRNGLLGDDGQDYATGHDNSD